MKADRRIRYWLDERGGVETFTDSPEARVDAVNRGATAFSVHSFSEDVRLTDRPGNIWGDFWGLISDPDDGRLPTSRFDYLCELLIAAGVARESVDLWKWQGGGYWVYIEEEAFRGECGSPSRLAFDQDIYDTAGVDFERMQMITLGSSMYPFVPASVFVQEKGAGYLDVVHGQLCSAQKGARVSLLAQSYYRKHNEHFSGYDALTHRPALLLSCLYFKKLMASAEPHNNEITLGLGLIGMSRHKARSLARKGAGELVAYLAAHCADGDGCSVENVCCSAVAERLKQIGSKLPCRGNCGVTTPRALPYVANIPGLLGFGEKRAGDLIVNSAGLFLCHEDGEGERREKIADPLLIQKRFHDATTKGTARELLAFGRDGRPVVIRLTDSLIKGPRFFPMLESYDVALPRDNHLKGKIREYLLAQAPDIVNVPAEIYRQYQTVSETGWYEGQFFVLPSVTIAPPGQIGPQFTVGESLSFVSTFWPYEPKVLSVVDTYTLFGLLAAMTAPFLEALNLPGFGVHFCGDNAELRTHAVQAGLLWWDKGTKCGVYDVEALKGGGRCLKSRHRHLVIGFEDINNGEQLATLRRFYRRYLIGRKGTDAGVVGVILSSAQEALVAHGKTGEDGALILNHQMLAINVDTSSQSYFPVSINYSEGGLDMLQGLTSRKGVWVKEIRERYNDALNFLSGEGGVNSTCRARSYFAACAAVAEFAVDLGCLRWGPPQTPTIIVSDLYSQWGAFDREIRNVLEALRHDNTKVVLDVRLLRKREGDYHLFPSNVFKRLLAQHADSVRMMEWLVCNKVLVPGARGKHSTVQRISKDKTVRGYLISVRHWQEMYDKFVAPHQVQAVFPAPRF